MEYKRFGGKLLVRIDKDEKIGETCLLYTSPSPRDTR